MNRKQKKAARAAMAAWEYKRKLAESEFYDIEGGVEGHLLKGASRSSLTALANQTLSNDRTIRDFDTVADSEHPDLGFFEGHKARYYHHAELLALQAIRECRLPDEKCLVWLLHAQGLGERIIGKLMGVPRSRTRKYLAHFRQNMVGRLDKE